LSEDSNPEKAPRNDALEAMHTAADTVGMVPNVRLKDNLIQGGVVLGGTLLSAIVGFFFLPGPHGERWVGAAAGAVFGLIGFGLLSGLVLMVLGWIRAARKIGKGGASG
jgi:hypothetical protein